MGLRQASQLKGRTNGVARCRFWGFHRGGENRKIKKKVDHVYSTKHHREGKTFCGYHVMQEDIQAAIAYAADLGGGCGVTSSDVAKFVF